MALGVDVMPDRSSPPAILLREAWREGPGIRRRTIANLSKAPPGLVEAVLARLRGRAVYSSIDAAISIRRARPHGHVAVVLGMVRSLGMTRIYHVMTSMHCNRQSIVPQGMRPAIVKAGLEPDFMARRRTGQPCLSVPHDLVPGIRVVLSVAVAAEMGHEAYRIAEPVRCLEAACA